MVTTRLSVSLVVIAVALVPIFSGVIGQAPAPGPSSDCFTEVLGLTDCLTFAEAGSNETKPEKGCCPSLAGLIESAPVCLCELFTNSNSFGVELDRTKALKLPSICNVTTPPISLCTGGSIVPASPTNADENRTSASRVSSFTSLIGLLIVMAVTVIM